MDKATLVRKDHQILGLVQEALSRAKIPVSLVHWYYDSEIKEQQLVIGTPLHDSKGPREAASRVIEALENAGIYEEVPKFQVSVISPEDSVTPALEQEVKNRSEGNITVVEMTPAKPSAEKVYSVIFSPYAARGFNVIPARHITGLEELRRFLEERLHIRKTSVDEALTELARERRSFISNVQLTNREAKKLGLA